LEWKYLSGKETFSRAAIAYRCGAVDFRILEPEIQTAASIDFAKFIDDYDLATKILPRPYRIKPISAWLPYWSADHVATEFVINASIFERDIRNKIGSVDILCSGVGLFQERDPLRLLRRMAWLSNEYVMFYTAITNHFVFDYGVERVRFGDSDMWPMAGLTAAQALALDTYWRERDVSLPQFEPYRVGQRWQLQEQKDWWFWFLSHGAIMWLLQKAGLELVNSVDTWSERGRWYLARLKGG
jgi:hypothetical protein